jgi:hypothetical protein
MESNLIIYKVLSLELLSIKKVKKEERREIAISLYLIRNSIIRLRLPSGDIEIYLQSLLSLTIIINLNILFYI